MRTSTFPRTSWRRWRDEPYRHYMSELGGRVILGLDPGTASTGFGVISVTGNRLRALEYGVIETTAGIPLEQRLEKIFAETGELLGRHQPSATAVESLFFNANVRTALAVGHARGVTLLACSLAGCGVFEYTPQQIKQAVVGYGKAEKSQVMEMVRVLLGLTDVPRPDHAADALGVAICHANTCGVRERVERALSRDAKRAVAP
jgi:crossover junction endodeoxyribonuclease RuvC